MDKGGCSNTFVNEVSGQERLQEDVHNIMRKPAVTSNTSLCQLFKLPLPCLINFETESGQLTLQHAHKLKASVSHEAATVTSAAVNCAAVTELRRRWMTEESVRNEEEGLFKCVYTPPLWAEWGVITQTGTRIDQNWACNISITRTHEHTRMLSNNGIKAKIPPQTLSHQPVISSASADLGFFFLWNFMSGNLSHPCRERTFCCFVM